MLKFIKGIVVTLLLFALVNFLYWNLHSNALGYAVAFQFNIPPYLFLTSEPFPIGFLLICAFFLGMILASALGFYRFLGRKVAIRRRDKRIKALEKQLHDLENKFPPVAHFPHPPPASAAVSRSPSPASRSIRHEEVAEAEFDDREDDSLFADFRRDFR